MDEFLSFNEKTEIWPVSNWKDLLTFSKKRHTVNNIVRLYIVIELPGTTTLSRKLEILYHGLVTRKVQKSDKYRKENNNLL